MAKISDAREGYKEVARFGMLNIWDVKSLGQETLKEGGRYLVSPVHDDLPTDRGRLSTPGRRGPMLMGMVGFQSDAW